MKLLLKSIELLSNLIWRSKSDQVITPSFHFQLAYRWKLMLSLAKSSCLHFFFPQHSERMIVLLTIRIWDANVEYLMLHLMFTWRAFFLCFGFFFVWVCFPWEQHDCHLDCEEILSSIVWYNVNFILKIFHQLLTHFHVAHKDKILVYMKLSFLITLLLFFFNLCQILRKIIF